MSKYLLTLSLLPSLVLAGNNTFIEQNLTTIQRQNQQITQRLQQARQQANQQALVESQAALNSRTMRSILGKKPLASPPSSTSPITTSPPVAPPVSSALPAETRRNDGATGFSQEPNPANQASDWNYGY